MSSFRAVNTTVTVLEAPPGRAREESTPTTPRPNKFFSPDQPSAERGADDAAAKTPTRDSFQGLTAQRLLSDPPFAASQAISETPSRDGGLRRGSSYQSNKSADSQDVDMEDEDDGQEGSDNESVNSDSNRPTKKKKGQRFFCTEFPPCNLSFTRSEHLARHIRKHTGERPFQCHCSRRFSRLDNLRQHAQTVHVNEDIPGDSLAATGTRFQRQIRTDRVRPPNNRSRASTLGSQGGQSRGHSRNVSASSITSTTSSMGQREDVRRQPQPLAMANDGAPRARLTLNTFTPPGAESPGGQFHVFGNNSPGGYDTPASATFSTGTSSPRFSSGLQSPVSTVPRSFMYGSRTPGRRLSVPSGANPFQAPQGHNACTPLYVSPLPSSAASTFSGNSSMLASPTSSIFSDARRGSATADELDWRRRTWHPGTNSGLGPRLATSGLSWFQNADASEPAFAAQPAASQVTRLPGIESFDYVPPQPAIARKSSPMQVDSPQRSAATQIPYERGPSGPDDRRGHLSWDAALHKGLTKLDIANSTPPKEPHSWMQGIGQPQTPESRPITAPYAGHFPPRMPGATTQLGQPGETSSVSADQVMTSRKNKRHGWYNGPLPLTQQQQRSQPVHVMHRTSPEDSSSSEGIPTPSSSSLGEYYPAILHSNGYVEMHPPGATVDDAQKVGISTSTHFGAESGNVPLQAYTAGPPQGGLTSPSRPDRNSFHGPHGGAGDMRRLEALVAVATREEQAVNPRP